VCGCRIANLRLCLIERLAREVDAALRKTGIVPGRAAFLDRRLRKNLRRHRHNQHEQPCAHGDNPLQIRNPAQCSGFYTSAVDRPAACGGHRGAEAD